MPIVVALKRAVEVLSLLLLIDIGQSFGCVPQRLFEAAAG
jgi:hypothetical protein